MEMQTHEIVRMYKEAADKHYGTMSIEDLKNMPIGNGGGVLSS